MKLRIRCGERSYSFSFCCVEVMAPSTESLFTRDLMLEAVPYSPTSMLVELAIWSVRSNVQRIPDRLGE